MANVYGETFQKALDYAIALHGNQMRKGAGERTISYVTHLLSVAALVGEQGGSEDEVIAALLHDAIEDHPRDGRTRAEIQAIFGLNVLEIVQGCTNIFDAKDIPMRLSKVPYISHLEHSPRSVHRVAIADKLHNARTTVMNLRADGGESVWKRFRGGRDDTLWYYRSLAEMFERVFPGEFATELTATVYVMHALAGAK